MLSTVRRAPGAQPLPIILLLSFIAVGAAIVLIVGNLAESQAAIGLLGVVIGAGLSAATSMLIAREDKTLKLATAALDRRLAVHQEAYALWSDIVSAVHHKDKIGEVVLKAQDWWKNNCLYLDPVSRQAFRDCMIFAVSHKDLLQGPRTKEGTEIIKESWSVIMRPGQTLAEGVALPSLGQAEKPADVPDA